MVDSPQGFTLKLYDDEDTALSLTVPPVDNGFRQAHQRQNLANQELTDANEQMLRSVPRNAMFTQTNWTGGATWWVPRHSRETANNYAWSKNMDTVSLPGSILPQVTWSEASLTELDYNQPIVRTPDGIFMIGNTTVEDANLDIYSFAADRTLTRVTGVSSGIASTEGTEVKSLVYDSATANCYHVTNDQVGYFHPTATKAQGQVLILSLQPVMQLAVHNGRLFFYGLDELREISDPTGTPSIANIYDDGMGIDYLTNLAMPSDPLIPACAFRLLIPTSEGLYYIKNVVTNNGLPQPWIFRVDRNAAGTDIGTPVATLDEGTVAIAGTWHLGSLVVSTTDQFEALIENDTSTGDLPITYYHVTPEGLGALGRPQGYPIVTHNTFPALDDTPAAIIGSNGPRLFIGGRKRIYVYEAIEGGFHPWLQPQTSGDKGVYHRQAQYLDSDGDPARIFFGTASVGITNSRYMSQKIQMGSAVVEASNDLYHIESNLIDFALPFERKRLARWYLDLGTTMGDEGEWSLDISADDSAWSTVATLAPTDASPISGMQITDLSALDESTLPLWGTRFQYRLKYKTTADGTPKASSVRGMAIEATTGVMLPTYQFIVDLGESVMENEVIDPVTAYAAVNTLAKVSDDVKCSFYFGEDMDALFEDLKVTIDAVEMWSDDNNNLMGRITVTKVTSETQGAT